ncbi:hypothetical protein Nepgr_008812 [Nepenthes gracilis]|uniref:Uncharacterized protein n=1 Tax=Nepenthes gracilis TaxID=150966 RepID=A0AAD3XJK8_NEPGR|nr:hypothetical protein Nepgr_008812 [Nepenthes gracilis]
MNFESSFQSKMDARNKLLEEDAHSISRSKHTKPQQKHFPTKYLFSLLIKHPQIPTQQTPFTQLPIHNELFQPRAEGTIYVHKGEDQELSLAEDLAQLSKENNHLHAKILNVSQRARKAETELQTIKQTLARTEGERDAVFVQYQQISNRLSKVMKDIVPAQRYTREVEEHVKLLNEQFGRTKMKLRGAESYCFGAEKWDPNDKGHGNVQEAYGTRDREVETRKKILNDLPLPSSNMNSRRKNGQSNDQILQNWKINEQKYDSNLMDRKTREQASVSVVNDIPYHELDIGEQHCMNTTSKSLTKKRVGLDEMEVAKKCSNSNEGQKIENILDRFAPDTQDLMGLQVLVEQVRTKLETFKKRKIGNDVEYDKLRDQLHDVENSVVQLLGINTELIKTVENRHSTSNINASLELDEIGNVSRRIVLNKVRRGSGKIERLKLEIQKIQYALQKLRTRRKVKEDAGSPQFTWAFY